MQQNSFKSLFSAFYPTPKTLNMGSFHLLVTIGCHTSRFWGAFHSVTFWIPGDSPFQGWNSYSPLHMWEKWAEGISDMFPAAHLVSGAGSLKSTYNLLLFKTASWHVIDCQAPLRTVIKINPISSMPLRVGSQIKAECQNSNKLPSTEVHLLELGLGVRGAQPQAYTELSTLLNPGASSSQNPLRISHISVFTICQYCAKHFAQHSSLNSYSNCRREALHSADCRDKKLSLRLSEQ